MYFTPMQAHVNQTFSCMNITLGTACNYKRSLLYSLGKRCNKHGN